MPKYCPKDKAKDQVKASKVKVGIVRCRRLRSTKVEYDMEPNPNMEGVAFTLLGKKKSKTMVMKAFPDTGYEQSLISEDLVKTMGLVLENDKKPIEGVDGFVPWADC